MAKYGINALVIGERIKQELKKQGKTSVWLAEQLGCHRTNIYKVYERATIDTGLLFHISLSQLLYVQPSLLLTDERRSYASLYLFASLTYLEGDDGTHMVAFLLVSFLVFAILDTKHSVKVMVELDDKVISEVCWYATAITSGKAHHLALVRQYLDIATLIESIDNDMSTIGLREGESHQRSTLRRTEFCCHVVVGEIYTCLLYTSPSPRDTR